MRITFLLISLLVISTRGYAADNTRIKIVDQDNQPVANAVVSISDETITPDVTEVAVMDQINKQFFPTVLIINKGQRVSFPNGDNIRHHVYSFSSIKPFEIRLYKGSNEAPILFDKSGLAVLGCNIHDNMVGYIYVAEQEQAKITDTTGEVVLDKPNIKEVMVWHPDLGVGSAQKLKVPLQQTGNVLIGQVSLNIVADEKPNTFRSIKFGQ